MSLVVISGGGPGIGRAVAAVVQVNGGALVGQG